MLQARKTLAVAKKDLRIYYVKGPVVIFGVLLPIFFFLAFLIGREMTPLFLSSGMIGMALWFTATSITPVITPWETRDKTLERLLSAPIGIGGILLGDILASSIMGLLITSVAVGIATVFLDVSLAHPIILGVGLLLGSLCFSAIGSLLAAIPTDRTSDVMMLSTLVKFPIIFVSGIFIPIAQLPPWGVAIAYLSPLTYLVGLTRYSFNGGGDPLLDVLALGVSALLFTTLAVLAHKRTVSKRI